MLKHPRFDLPRWQSALGVTATAVAVLVAVLGPALRAQSVGEPYAALLPATALAFPNDTDSNSPAVWEIVDGTWTLSLLNSVAGQSQISRGPSVQRLRGEGQVTWQGAAPPGGVWIESVIRDADSWYAFYHNEREHVVCEGSGKVWPRIGAARSDDRGLTWTDLGPVIDTPATSVTCDTNNHYFVGGVGDFSVVLGPGRNYAYFYYTQYVEADDQVGVSVARMAWADRDQPSGRVDIWNDGAWIPPTTASQRVSTETDDELPSLEEWEFPLATPIFPAANRWDNARPGVDVLWGPSIHWNTSLRSYVMLLNRAADNEWTQGAVLVSFNPSLDDPGAWTPPSVILRGGSWYPQVIGLDPTAGTDTYAGGVARFFMGGKSEHLVIFRRR